LDTIVTSGKTGPRRPRDSRAYLDVVVVNRKLFAPVRNRIPAIQ